MVAKPVNLTQESARKLSLDRWRTFVGCVLGVITSAGFSSAFNVFLLPVSHEFGWGRSVFSFAYLMSTTASALAYPFFGWMVDRWGTKKVLVPGLIAHALSMMTMSLIDGSKTQLIALYVFFGLALPFGGFLAFGRLIVGWFHERRGLALAISIGGGAAIGGAINPQAAGFLVEQLGWRHAYIALAMPSLFVALPCVLFLVKEPPTLLARQEEGATVSVPVGMTRQEALRTRSFWFLLISIFLVAVGWDGPKGHMVAWRTDLGETREFALLILSVIAITGWLGRLLEGYLMDVIKSPIIGIPPALLILAGILLLQFGPVGPGSAALLAAVVLGLGVGAEHTLGSYFVSRLFGVRAYSQIYGIIMCCHLLALGFGPLMMGYLFDELQSYTVALTIVEVMLVLGALAMSCVGPYRYAAQRKH